MRQDSVTVVTSGGHRETTTCVRSIRTFHMDGRGWSDIGCNFLVDNKGRIYEGRGWLVVGAHATGHNTSGMGVCFIGRDSDATDAAKRLIRWLYDQARAKAGHPLSKNGYGQLSGNSTNHPGKQLLAWCAPGCPRPAGRHPSRLPAARRSGRALHHPAAGHARRRRQDVAGADEDRQAHRRDGAYGPKPEAVCRAFQKERKLSVDGINGPKMWAAAW